MANTWKCAPKTTVSKALFSSLTQQLGFLTLSRLAMVEYLSKFWKNYEWTIIFQKLGFLGSSLHSRLNGQSTFSNTKGPTMMESLAIAHKNTQIHSKWNKAWRTQEGSILYTRNLINDAEGIITLVCFIKTHKYHVDVRDVRQATSDIYTPAQT